VSCLPDPLAASASGSGNVAPVTNPELPVTAPPKRLLRPLEDTLELPSASRPAGARNVAGAGNADRDRVGGGVPAGDEGEPRHRRMWIEFPILVLSALLIAVFIKTFLFQAFWIPSSSMENTLEINDRVLVNKLSYRFGDIQRGDVVVFDDPNGEPSDESVVGAILRNLRESVGLSTPKSEFIKRVVGISGDTVEISGGVLVVNGEAINEPYLPPRTDMPDFGPATVGDGELFVMGDNRNASQDSRIFGTVDAGGVVGQAFVIIWPVDRWGGL